MHGQDTGFGDWTGIPGIWQFIGAIWLLFAVIWLIGWIG